MICSLCTGEAVNPILTSDGHVCSGHIYRPEEWTPDMDLAAKLPPLKIIEPFDYHGAGLPYPLPMPHVPVPTLQVTIRLDDAERLKDMLLRYADTGDRSCVWAHKVSAMLNVAIKQEVGICVL